MLFHDAEVGADASLKPGGNVLLTWVLQQLDAVRSKMT